MNSKMTPIFWTNIYLSFTYNFPEPDCNVLKLSSAKVERLVYSNIVNHLFKPASQNTAQ